MKGNKEILMILAGGVLLGLPWSIPPLFFAIFFAWLPLFWLEEKSQTSSNPYALFNTSFLCFLIWNMMGTWWIAQAQSLGAILIILLNSLVLALVFWASSRIRKTLRIPLFFPLLLIWLGFEHFHQSWDLAWPWLNLGNSMATAPQLVQWYEYTGVRGGSLWILLINLSLWYLIQTIQHKNRRSILLQSSTALALFVLPLLFSHKLGNKIERSEKTIQVALVQPHLDPYTEKFDPRRQEKHLAEFYAMADSVCNEDTQLLFGPETLIVQQVEEEKYKSSPYIEQLQSFRMKHPGLTCLLGLHTYHRLGETVPPGSRYNKKEGFYYEAFNSAMYLEENQEAQFYHKTRLVPLFERMPFVDYLRFLGSYSLELGGYNGTYSKRQARQTFISSDSSYSILPIVCFESVFGPYCAQRLPSGYSFVTVLTNDGWWKNTPGYYHHFNFSRLRAIETRRDIVRVANNGISAIINSKGTVIASTPWWKRASLSGTVQLYQGQTFFAQHGDFVGRISLFFGILLILYGAIRIHIGSNNKINF